jgi:hypothetical protein
MLISRIHQKSYSPNIFFCLERRLRKISRNMQSKLEETKLKGKPVIKPQDAVMVLAIEYENPVDLGRAYNEFTVVKESLEETDFTNLRWDSEELHATKANGFFEGNWTLSSGLNRGEKPTSAASKITFYYDKEKRFNYEQTQFENGYRVAWSSLIPQDLERHIEEQMGGIADNIITGLNMGMVVPRPIKYSPEGILHFRDAPTIKLFRNFDRFDEKEIQKWYQQTMELHEHYLTGDSPKPTPHFPPFTITTPIDIGSPTHIMIAEYFSQDYSSK